MDFFPPLVRDDTLWLLPCTEAAAAALAHWWLDPDSPGAMLHLRRVLGSDAPLALWVAAQVPGDDGQPPAESWPRWLANGALLRFADPWTDVAPGQVSQPTQGDPASNLAPAAGAQATNGFPPAMASPADESWVAEQVASDAERAQAVAPPEALDPRALAALCASADIWLARCCLPGAAGSEDLLAESWSRNRSPAHGNGAARTTSGQGDCPGSLAAQRVWGQAGACTRHDVEGWLNLLARQLRDARRSASALAEQLHREKLASLAEFAAGAGHEMNNPLAVISGRAQLLLADERDPARRRELAAIQQQAGRVHEMIADLMLFARPPAPRPESCDLSGLVERVAQELGSRARERGIQLETRLEACPAPARVDPAQLAVALRALVENALRAVPAGGRITITLRAAAAPAEGVELVVADSGPGLSPDVRRHLFDPYFSGYPAGRGLGLGLSKAWRIARLYGGDLTVSEPSTEGATFVFSLPATVFGGAAGDDPPKTLG